jgi:DsbC/DsbD-like thiol-disulfide interchange protein
MIPVPVFAIVFSVVVAQAPTGDAKNVTATKHLAITTSVGTVPAKPSTRINLIVDVVPKPRMHVYSPEQKDYIPISLTLTVPDGVRAGQPHFPKAEKYFFTELKETQLVYSKAFRITQPITLTTPVSSPITISGTVRYQACDDSICYLPQDVAVSWRIDR